MQIGDLVCCKWDVSKGLIDPLGIITDIKEWNHNKKNHILFFVFLFKSRTIDAFSLDRLIKLEDIPNEKN